MSGQEGQTFEHTLSFRDRVLDYKKKYEETAEKMKNEQYKNQDEQDALNDKILALKKEKREIEQVSNRLKRSLEVYESRVEMAERDVTTYRREIQQTRDKITKYMTDATHLTDKLQKMEKQNWRRISLMTKETESH